MSMTREEAIEILRKRQRYCKVIAEHANETVKADELREIEAIDLALAALRGLTREMVERMRGGVASGKMAKRHTQNYLREVRRVEWKKRKFLPSLRRSHDGRGRGHDAGEVEGGGGR